MRDYTQKEIDQRTSSDIGSYVNILQRNIKANDFSMTTSSWGSAAKNRYHDIQGQTKEFSYLRLNQSL